MIEKEGATMRSRFLRRLVPRNVDALVLSVCVMGMGGEGGALASTVTYSPVQASARPFGLNIVNQVAIGGSDALSADFMSDTLPTMHSLIQQYLPERQAVTDLSRTEGLVALDPARLRLAAPADVRVYFVGEGAGFHNSLGFTTNGGGFNASEALLIFPDASSSVSYLNPSANGARTGSTPLLPGDFVELGSFDAGTSFDFFLIADGANPNRRENAMNVFWTDIDRNVDGIDHVVAFAHVESPYLLVGFEDLLGGGDLDYNDVLFAVYIGEQNVTELIQSASIYGSPVPEPGFLWLMIAGYGGWLWRVRSSRRKRLPDNGRGC